MFESTRSDGEDRPATAQGLQSPPEDAALSAGARENSTTRFVEGEAPLHDDSRKVVAQGCEEVGRRSTEEDVHIDAKQLPTPSPSSNSTESRANRIRPPSSSASSARNNSRKGRVSQTSMRGRATEEPNETRGADGKEYQLHGMYFSPGITPKNPSLSASTAGSAPVGSQSRPRTAATTSFSWRTIQPSISTILPPPIHYGLMLLGEAPKIHRKLDDPASDEDEDSDESEDEEDEPECGFKLPFDILRDFYYAEGAAVHGKGDQRGEPEDEVERRESSRKPAHYRHIQTNYYVDRKRDKVDVAAVCACKPPRDRDEPGCLADCINRMMQYCCDPKLCPCGAQCSNLPLNKRPTVEEGRNGLRVIWVGSTCSLFGLGGDLVIEYRGEIISRDESYRRVTSDYKDRSDYYFLEYDSFEVIDAGQRGNSARFINHSCGPNCEVVRWRLASVDEFQVGVFARRDIRPGEELTYNYGWQNFVDLADSTAAKPAASTSTSSPDGTKGAKAAEAAANDIARQRCFCGSPACSGYLGGKPKQDPAASAQARSVKAKECRQASHASSPATERAVKRQKSVPLEWAPAKTLAKAEMGRKASDFEDSEQGTASKKPRKLSTGTTRTSRVRGAALKANERLAGQR
ncbi:hypothetical protein JCM3766R1_000851 [Sporobolomyces carnicolor]